MKLQVGSSKRSHRQYWAWGSGIGVRGWGLRFRIRKRFSARVQWSSEAHIRFVETVVQPCLQAPTGEGSSALRSRGQQFTALLEARPFDGAGSHQLQTCPGCRHRRSVIECCPFWACSFRWSTTGSARSAVGTRWSLARWTTRRRRLLLPRPLGGSKN